MVLHKLINRVVSSKKNWLCWSGSQNSANLLHCIFTGTQCYVTEKWSEVRLCGDGGILRKGFASHCCGSHLLWMCHEKVPHNNGWSRQNRSFCSRKCSQIFFGLEKLYHLFASIIAVKLERSVVFTIECFARIVNWIIQKTWRWSDGMRCLARKIFLWAKLITLLNVLE